LRASAASTTPWLIDQLWTAQAVGIIGVPGTPGDGSEGFYRHP
jgi:hypothetical protein